MFFIWEISDISLLQENIIEFAGKRFFIGKNFFSDFYLQIPKISFIFWNICCFECYCCRVFECYWKNTSDRQRCLSFLILQMLIILVSPVDMPKYMGRFLMRDGAVQCR